MLNTLMLYGGKAGPDLGIGQEMDFDSMHNPGTSGNINIVDAEMARSMIQRPPHSKWSSGFEYRYAMSFWVCPHKWTSGAKNPKYIASVHKGLASNVGGNIVIDWTKSEGEVEPRWEASQVVPGPPAGSHAPTHQILIGHRDGSNTYARAYPIKRLWWQHFFVKVDLREAVPEDRQKVWIDGKFVAGVKLVSYHGTLNDMSTATAGHPANPWLYRKWPGSTAIDAPLLLDGPEAQNMTLGFGRTANFWGHPEYLPTNNPGPNAAIAAFYFIDDEATVDQIGQVDPVTSVWSQKPLLPRFGGASVYINFKDRTGDQVGINTQFAKDQLGTVNTRTWNARQNVSGARNTFRGKAEQVLTYPNIP